MIIIFLSLAAIGSIILNIFSWQAIDDLQIEIEVLKKDNKNLLQQLEIACRDRC